MQIWRVNVNTQTLNKEPIPAGWEKLGGRGLVVRALLDEMDATCDPLGPGNKIIFAPRLLVGHMLSSTDRISIGGKSPLSRGVKESNAGGRTGYHMAFMGMKSAGIQNLDKDRIPSRIAARGGLGAVIGSKGLKAVVFDHTGGQKPALADAKAFKAAQKDFTKSVMEHPQSQTYRDYGTPAMAQMTQHFSALPTHNFSKGTFEQVDKISGETLRELILQRGKPSDPSHACMAGCTIKCSNVFGGEDCKVIVSPLKY